MCCFSRSVQELGDSIAYAPFFEDLKMLDLQHAKQVTHKVSTVT